MALTPKLILLWANSAAKVLRADVSADPTV